MGSQRVGHDWATELTDEIIVILICFKCSMNHLVFNSTYVNLSSTVSITASHIYNSISYFRFILPRSSLVAQMVKHLPIMQETLVWSLGQEDPLEKEMATHCSTLAWRIPWMEKPGELQSMGSQRVRHNWAISQKEGSNPKDMSQKSKPKKKELTQTGRY